MFEKMRNVGSSQSERVNFYEMATEVGREMARGNGIEEMLQDSPDALLEISLDTVYFVDGTDLDDYERDCALTFYVDDVDEAKGQYRDGFISGVESFVVGEIEDRFCQMSTGDKDALIVEPGGQRGGLDYGPRFIEIVILDNGGDTIAYRYSDDSVDDDWLLADGGNLDNAEKLTALWMEKL